MKFDFYFFSFLVLMILTDKTGIISYGFLFALAHELGHILAMKIFKVKIEKIKFGFVNIDLFQNNFEKNIGDRINIIILFSGFFVNAVLCLMFYICFCNSGERIYYYCSMQNLFIGALNILPIDSLDGGKILRIFLNKHFDFLIVEKILKIVSIVILIPVLCLGVCIFFYSSSNFSLIILALYLVIYLFKGVIL